MRQREHPGTGIGVQPASTLIGSCVRTSSATGTHEDPACRPVAPRAGLFIRRPEHQKAAAPRLQRAHSGVGVSSSVSAEHKCRADDEFAVLDSSRRCATLVALKQVERSDHKQWRALKSLHRIQVIGGSSSILERRETTVRTRLSAGISENRLEAFDRAIRDMTIAICGDLPARLVMPVPSTVDSNRR